MAGFAPIQTQEEFDALIKDRLAQKESSVRKEYADYESIKKELTDAKEGKTKLEADLSAATKKAAELEEKLRVSETDSAKTRIALKHGLPVELAARLTGSTESEIEEDAKSLEALIGAGRAAPLYSTEQGDDKKAAAWSGLVRGLVGQA